MAKKSKFYVVWEGNETGIFDTWPACQAAVKGYPNAKYKSFKTLAEAEDAYGGTAFDHIGSGAKKSKKPILSIEMEAEIEWNSIAVDAACSGNPGDMEYRGVDTKTGTELFRQGPFPQGTNNVGEFLALVHGLAQLKKEGKHDLPIYSDSRIAMGWVRKKQVNTKLKRSHKNDILFQLIDRGIFWLKNNTFKNPILKWETKKWGEIPADFGRK